MHQITIRLLLGIVITVSQYKTQTAADFAGCQHLSAFESASTQTRILFLIV